MMICHPKPYRDDEMSPQTVQIESSVRPVSMCRDDEMSPQTVQIEGSVRPVTVCTEIMGSHPKQFR